MERPPRHLQSAEGWYIAIVIERFEYYDEDVADPTRECTAWENTILVQADSHDMAYEKAAKIGKATEGVECTDDSGRKGEWKFVGLGELLPVYEKIEDGAELMWMSHESITVEDANNLASHKSSLAVFRKE